MATILGTIKKWFGATATSKKGRKGRNKKGQFMDAAFTSKQSHEKAYAPKRKTRAHKHPSHRK
jgi:hypothetical protein